MAAAEFDHDLLRGLVFHRSQAQEGSGGRRRVPRPAGADAAGRRRKWSVPRTGSRPAWPRHRRPALETEAWCSTPRLSRSRMNCRLSRGPAPRSVISQVSVASPCRSAGSLMHPAGTRKENAADCSQCIGWARSTRPLGKTCERMETVTRVSKFGPQRSVSEIMSGLHGFRRRVGPASLRAPAHQSPVVVGYEPIPDIISEIDHLAEGTPLKGLAVK